MGTSVGGIEVDHARKVLKSDGKPLPRTSKQGRTYVGQVKFG